MVRTKGDDADEQRVIDDVQEFGWHVLGIEADLEGPGFAYSIGMHHTMNHPEVIIFGLDDARTMMQVINVIGEEVRKGEKFEDWHESDQVLEGYPCMFRTVPDDAYPDYLGYAIWFYRPESFPVLQCVWPDKQGRYPWEPECQRDVRHRQPVLSRQVGWPFHEAKNRAVFTTSRVLDGSHPILVVSHDEEGDWQFLCGTTNDPKDGRIVALDTIVNLHPALAELADLPEGWMAMRESVESGWTRTNKSASTF